jgi:hypothetical protein
MFSQNNRCRAKTQTGNHGNNKWRISRSSESVRAFHYVWSAIGEIPSESELLLEDSSRTRALGTLGNERVEDYPYLSYPEVTSNLRLQLVNITQSNACVWEVTFWCMGFYFPVEISYQARIVCIFLILMLTVYVGSGTFRSFQERQHKNVYHVMDFTLKKFVMHNSSRQNLWRFIFIRSLFVVSDASSLWLLPHVTVKISHDESLTLVPCALLALVINRQDVHCICKHCM